MRVVFVQKFVPHYRLPFFERVRAELGERGIPFELVYGQPDPFEGSKVRTVEPEWGTRVNSRIPRVAGRYLYWQNALRHVGRGDLVVVEHAAKLVDNYLIYALSRLGRVKMGYFGHGENFQSRHELVVSRWLKEQMLRRVARWFAYTEISRRSLLRQGVDDALITVVNNTLARPANSREEEEKPRARFLYIGGLYRDKRLDLVIEAAARTAARVSGLELHVVGDGPERALVERAAEEHDWLTYHGSLYGEERDRALAGASAILMPGLVGLVAVDSFFFRAPIITSHGGQHSPEVAYLEHDVNALFDAEDGDEASFADLMTRFVEEPGLAARLQSGCRESADRYTIEDMARRFCDGVEACR